MASFNQIEKEEIREFGLRNCLSKSPKASSFCYLVCLKKDFLNFKQKLDLILKFEVESNSLNESSDRKDSSNT
jgi:hypothetical protein